MNLNKEISFKPKKKIRLPSKSSINLIKKEDNHIHFFTVLPSVILICLIAAAISKFAVVDLFNELSEAQGRLNVVQRQLNDCYSEIDSYGELKEKYAHYTYSGMTVTELSTVSRSTVLELIRDCVLPYAKVGSWSVSYNTVNLPITCETLEDINVIVQRMNNDERVDFCTVTTAKTDAKQRSSALPADVINTEEKSSVTAQVTVFLNEATKGALN